MSCIDIIEPERIKVVWKNHRGDGSNFHVADLLRLNNGNVEFLYNSDSEDFKSAKELGFEGYFAFPLKQSLSFRDGVMSVLSRRLPPRSRSDFNNFLEQWAIPKEQDISDFALLGYSRGALPGDDFSFYPYWEDYDLPCSFLIEVAGFRYSDGMGMNLSPESEIVFRKSPDNPKDARAISIWADGCHIGFVNRTLTTAFHKWLDMGVEVDSSVYRVNGTETRPRVHLHLCVGKNS
ncbi:MAG: HIRAN domain-containing protein [Bdellovibrionales bacterium]